ncbi:MAG: rhodanese-like domain-containing protein [Edaphobacter sp.]|uniref:rhodanese-like domain-containing protein n=1 Tax=Edaphobacter sp. TaxID=1934404 RepID=UPI0023A20D95|nr:rhodanese-like domain-containing protein [Edaphobacter sp.]MDE1176352.1 rhodanese-like domain-containing protein [Edaphobacter sp.]
MATVAFVLQGRYMPLGIRSIQKVSDEVSFRGLTLREMNMLNALGLVFTGFAILFGTVLWRRRARRLAEMRQHLISPNTLREMLTSPIKPTLLDLRLPLDFLAHTEIIPGAKWIAPSAILADPNMLSKEIDYVLYCTCPGEESTGAVLAAAHKMGFLKVRVLAGGIEAWEKEGFPVEPYNRPFHLDAN